MSMTDEEHDAIEALPDAERESFRALRDLIGEREELHPDLQAYIEENGPLGTCIKHPLVYQMLHHGGLNAHVNKIYAAKRESIAQAMREGRWSTVIWLHERPYRLNAFMDIARHLKDKAYWDLLGGVWVDSENIWQNYHLWREALECERSCRWAMMTMGERKVLRDLKRRRTPVMVYRGYAHHGKDEGLSWTLDRSRAEWFARRFAGMENREHPMCAHGLVDAEHIIARFDGRGEREVVVFPEHVHVHRTVALS